MSHSVDVDMEMEMEAAWAQGEQVTLDVDMHPGSAEVFPSLASERGLSRRALAQIMRGTSYALVELLGQGGMGEVYEAEHRALGRRCVVKILRAQHRDRAEFARRLRDEARVLARLRHPNLVEVFDLGTTADGRPFFAMELLSGRDLRRELDLVGSLPPRYALDVVIQALAGLGAAHEAGIVHRDVKLENLFLCADGTVKLLDFGVAKRNDDVSCLTGEGRVVGTPRTMAPEQHGLGEVDARADLYAMGLVLYELCAGRGPFDELRNSPHALRYAHGRRPPPPPSMFACDPIAEGLERAIMRALAKDPSDRFASAREMADELRRLAGERRRRRGPPPAEDRDTALCATTMVTVGAGAPSSLRRLGRLVRAAAPALGIALGVGLSGAELLRAEAAPPATSSMIGCVSGARK